MNDELPLKPDTLHPADRSILETAAECPRQAAFLESGQILKTAFCMESGNAVHQACSDTITEYVGSRGAVSPNDLQDFFLQRLAMSRPDAQSDAIKGGKPIAWPLSRYLSAIHWENIRCWDGGRGEHSSQLAYDLEEFELRLTSELDLLHDSESPEVMTEVDFKSGWGKWNIGKVADSFQFQFHAILVLLKYPDIKAVQVRIWCSRMQQLLYPVLFKREKLYDYQARVRNAAAAYYKARGKSPNDVEAWPLVEKCEACPAAHLCDESKMPEITPEDCVDLIALLEAKVAALSKIAKKAVVERGTEIVTPLGNMFGKERPKRKVSPKFEVYQLKSSKEETPETETENQ